MAVRLAFAHLEVRAIFISSFKKGHIHSAMLRNILVECGLLLRVLGSLSVLKCVSFIDCLITKGRCVCGKKEGIIPPNVCRRFP